MSVTDNEVTGESDRQEHSASHSQQRPTWPIQVVAWAVIGVVLYIGKAAFAPLLFSVLLAILLSPFVDALQRWRVPRGAASLITVGLLVGFIVMVVDSAWSPAVKWIDNAPSVLQTVEKKIRPLQKTLARIDSITTRATTITNTTTARSSAIAPTPTPTLDTLDLSRAILIGAATIFILTFFLLMAGGRTLGSIESTLAQRGRWQPWMQILYSVRSELSRYYLTLATINIGLGLVTTAALALWGLSNPWLWGILAGVLNFIPYVGPALTLVTVTTVALVSFDGYVTAIGVAGTFLAIATIEGQLVQPLLIGFRLNINPVALFIAIWLASWFWGVAGVFLVTPMLIVLKEITNLRSGPSLLKAVLTAQQRPAFLKSQKIRDVSIKLGEPPLS